MNLSKAASDTLEKVSSEFESEVLADLQGGRGDAMALIQSSKRETSEAVVKILETGSRQAESLKRQMVGAAELETRNDQLRSMESAMTEVFSSAVSRVSKTGGARYERSMVQLIREGVEVIGPKAKVSCSSKDRKVVASAIRKVNGGAVRLALGEASVETIGGVMLTSADGSVRFDNTFESRLERMRPDLRKEIAGLLGGSKAQPS